MHACMHALHIALHCIALHYIALHCILPADARTQAAGQSGLAAFLLRKLSSSRRGSFQEHCRRQPHSLQKRKNSGFRVLHRSDMIGHTLFSRCSNLVLPSFQKLTTNLEQSIWGLEFSRANPTLFGTAATLGSSWLSGPSFRRLLPPRPLSKQALRSDGFSRHVLEQADLGLAKGRQAWLGFALYIFVPMMHHASIHLSIYPNWH